MDSCSNCRHLNAARRETFGSRGNEIVGECENIHVPQRAALKSEMPCGGKHFSEKEMNSDHDIIKS